jgi:hypothetical protein
MIHNDLIWLKSEMGIVHSWFESGWNWIGIGLMLLGLVLMNVDGVFRYVGGACLVAGLGFFYFSSDREDYTKI